jgi:hypothetical protein
MTRSEKPTARRLAKTAHAIVTDETYNALVKWAPVIFL